MLLLLAALLLTAATSLDGLGPKKVPEFAGVCAVCQAVRPATVWKVVSTMDM